MSICRYFYGSDGTRTRDLRRDQAGSGVTTVGDDRPEIALLMRFLGGLAIRFRMIERSRFQTFAAHLLPAGTQEVRAQGAQDEFEVGSDPARRKQPR